MNLKIKKNVNIVRRGKESLIYSNEIGRLFKIDEVGEFIINLIKKVNPTKEQLLKKLKKEFKEVDEKILKADLEDFLNELKKEGLL